MTTARDPLDDAFTSAHDPAPLSQLETDLLLAAGTAVTGSAPRCSSPTTAERISRTRGTRRLRRPRTHAEHVQRWHAQESVWAT